MADMGRHKEGRRGGRGGWEGMGSAKQMCYGAGGGRGVAKGATDVCISDRPCMNIQPFPI